MSHRLVHPQHLGISGGVRAEGALVAREALPVQGSPPAALAPHTQIHRGQTRVKAGGLSRAVGGRRHLKKRPLYLSITTWSASVGGGAGDRAGSVFRGSRVVNPDVSQIGLGFGGDKVTKTADVGFLICGEKKCHPKGQRGEKKPLLIYSPLGVLSP